MQLIRGLPPAGTLQGGQALTVGESLFRLTTEALAIADADDNALAGRQVHYKQLQLLTQLRVVCVHLLSAAMASDKFLNPNNPSHNTVRVRALFPFRNTETDGRNGSARRLS